MPLPGQAAAPCTCVVCARWPVSGRGGLAALRETVLGTLLFTLRGANAEVDISAGAGAARATAARADANIVGREVCAKVAKGALQPSNGRICNHSRIARYKEIFT